MKCHVVLICYILPHWMQDLVCYFQIRYVKLGFRVMALCWGLHSLKLVESWLEPKSEIPDLFLLSTNLIFPEILCRRCFGRKMKEETFKDLTKCKTDYWYWNWMVEDLTQTEVLFSNTKGTSFRVRQILIIIFCSICQMNDINMGKLTNINLNALIWSTVMRIKYEIAYKTSSEHLHNNELSLTG